MAAVLAASARLDFISAVDFGHQAVAEADTAGDPAIRALARCWLGPMMATYDPQDARHHLVEAIELARGVGDLTVLADARNGMAYTDVNAGGLEDGLVALEEVLELTRRTGNRITRCHAVALLATAELMRGRLEPAWEASAEALPTAREVNDGVYIVLLFVVQEQNARPGAFTSTPSLDARTPYERSPSGLLQSTVRGMRVSNAARFHRCGSAGASSSLRPPLVCHLVATVGTVPSLGAVLAAERARGVVASDGASAPDVDHFDRFSGYHRMVVRDPVGRKYVVHRRLDMPFAEGEPRGLILPDIHVSEPAVPPDHDVRLSPGASSGNKARILP